MENASKALIMAASILIAIMTIGALIFMFDSISGVEMQKDQNAEIDAVLEFNRQFEQFDKVGLRGSDILTVINKMIDYNEKVTEEDQGYNTVTMSILFKQLFKDPVTDNEVSTTNSIGLTTLETWHSVWFEKTSTELQSENLKEFKRKYFKCTGVGYDNTSGRVNNMTFEEIIVH